MKNQTLTKAPRLPRKLVLPEFANVVDPTEPISGPAPSGGFDRHTGKVFFANESWFDTTYYSEPLTQYVVGWRDPNDIEATLQFLAPQIPVPGRLFEYKLAVNAEEFVSEVVDDERAIGANFKTVEYTGTDATAKTLNRGLMTIIDLDRVSKGSAGGSAPPPWQQSRVAKMTRRLYRNSVRRAVAALSTAAVTTADYHWTAQPPNPDVVPVQPDMDVSAELLNATNVSGIRPNRVVYGDSAWLFRDQAYAAQNNPGGYIGYGAGAIGVEDQMATKLRVDKVLISQERYQSSNAAKSEILGPNVYMYYAEDDLDVEDPSNIKRFVSTFDEEQGGGLFRVYVQQLSAKLVAISVEFYEIIIVTYSGGIRKMPIKNV